MHSSGRKAQGSPVPPRHPLAKCDLVALPDFAAGAMENWGLITFREQALYLCLSL